MHNLKNINFADFKKCGEILVASEIDTLAISCNYCQEIFKQLQSFMRHLQLQHNNELQFCKKTKDVEVYTVEELMNHGLGTPDLKNFESNLCEYDIECLSEADKERPDSGTISLKNNEIESIDDKEDFRITNASLLRALEDCDVSSNFLNNFCEKKNCDKQFFENKLLKEISNDWDDDDDTDANHTTVDGVMANSLTEVSKINECNEESFNKRREHFENKTNNTIKSILEDLEDLTDVDSLLENLEGNLTVSVNRQVNTLGIVENKNCSSQILDFLCNDNTLSAKNSTQNKTINNGKIIINTILAQNNGKSTAIQFKECGKPLQNDISNINSVVYRCTNFGNLDSSPNSGSIDNQIENFEFKLRGFEQSFTEDNIIDNTNSNYIETIQSNVKDNFYKIDRSTIENLEEENVKVLQGAPLNEDIAKILEDALEAADLDLLNILRPGEESEDTVSEDIHNLLKQEMKKGEYDQNIPKKQDNTSLNAVLNNKMRVPDNTMKMQKNTSSVKSNTETTKYKITNLKSKAKLAGNKNMLNPTKILTLKDSNRILLTSQKHNLIPEISNTQNKINQESSTPTNVENTKQEIPPAKVSINMDKEEKIPVKREVITLNQTAKFNEIQKRIEKVQAEQKITQTNFIQKYIPPSMQQKNLTVKIRREPQTKSKMNEEDNYKTTELPKTQSSLISRELNIDRTNEKNSIPHYLHNGVQLEKTTPQKLRNVTIKLEKITPEKLTRILKNPARKVGEAEITEVKDTFKLPKGNILKRVDQSDIVETPVKTNNYWKQNFSESSLKNISLQETKKQSLIQPQIQVIKNFKGETIFPTLRQRKASIDILPCSVENSVHNKTPRNSTLDYKSYAASRSSRKKEVLQRMKNIKKQIFKSIEKSESDDVMPVMNLHKKINKNVSIKSVDILPNLNNTELLTLNDISNLTVFSERFLNNNSVISANDNTKNSKENQSGHFIAKSFKRKASTSPFNGNNHTKRQCTTPHKYQEIVGKSSHMKTTKLDLSKNFADFSQQNSKDENLPEDLNTTDGLDDSNIIINDLLKQVAAEQPTIQEIGTKTNEKNDTTKKFTPPTNADSFEDFDDKKDIHLLAKLGLQIIKLPQIEDNMTIDECDKMREKADKFAKIYMNLPRIWSTKNSESKELKNELNLNLKELLIETNKAFNIALTVIELKRLLNLINIWYKHNCSSKFIGKRKIPESINRYLLKFSFLPKNMKRFYHCEYCNENFTAEDKYSMHRITHTGALYAYTCIKCHRGYKTLRTLRNHESVCNILIKADSAPHKCQVCEEKFETSKLLYEHSKKHLKTTYNCAKCKLTFAYATDVKNHMAVCNSGPKLMPKQYTPRRSTHKPVSFIKN